MFNAANNPSGNIIAQVQVVLIQIRDAMQAAESLQGWQSGVALADLTAQLPDGPGMSAPDAQALLSACADAGGLAQLYNTGTDTRNPPANYNYGLSQKIVIGPRPRLGRRR